MYIYWILLGLAIATEITGTLSMKWASVSEGNGGFILMLVVFYLLPCLAFCYSTKVYR